MDTVLDIMVAITGPLFIGLSVYVIVSGQAGLITYVILVQGISFSVIAVMKWRRNR